MIAFGFFFFDGIWGYTPIVTHTYERWQCAVRENIPVAVAAREYYRPWERAQVLTHVVSWPFVFLFGVFQWRPVTPIAACITTIERRLSALPDGCPQVTVAVVLWLLVGLVVRAARSAIRAGGGTRTTNGTYR